MKKSFEIEINVPAAKAWVCVGEKFGDAGQWTSFIDSSYMVGDLKSGGHRVCLKGDKKLTEHITKIDSKNMVLEYELIEGRPVIISSARNKWVVTPRGDNHCMVSMNPDINLRWWAVLMTPLLSFGLNSDLSKIMEEFKYWVENNEVHPRKNGALSEV